MNKMAKRSGGQMLPHDLVKAIDSIYSRAEMNVAEVTPEAESSEYGAYRFTLDGMVVVFRIAKTTPTKVGQFVTIWKRPTAASEISPLDACDGIDFVVINVSDKKHRGQFVFAKDVLIAKGIMSREGKGGKRAIRVYPPWSKPVAKDAIKSQKWQLQHFFSIADDGQTDLGRVRDLFAKSCIKFFAYKS